MKKIITLGMAFTLLGALSACQAQPDQQININQPKAEGTINIQPATEVDQGTPSTMPTSPEGEVGEKTEPVEPVMDYPVLTDAPTAPSREDFDNFTKAIETGDIALCDRIVDENLKRQCNTELSAEETPPQEESVSIITPGTPQ